MIPHTPALKSEIEALCELARRCAAREWVPATSGNFSVRDAESGCIYISPSGLDKGEMKPETLLQISANGEPAHHAAAPSAEAGLHAAIYRSRAEAQAIAHVHTIWNTLLSAHCAADGAVSLHGYELLKGLAGVTSHWHCERIPILANSQNYAELTEELTRALAQNPYTHGVLLSAHGLYTWGKSVAEARRHLEALEFLFEVEARKSISAKI